MAQYGSSCTMGGIEDGIILVYDICDRESFKNVDQWLNEVNRFLARICQNYTTRPKRVVLHFWFPLIPPGFGSDFARKGLIRAC